MGPRRTSTLRSSRLVRRQPGSSAAAMKQRVQASASPCTETRGLGIAQMVSSDHAKTLLLGSVVPAAALALLLLAQWRSTSCAFLEQPPGSGLLTCTQAGAGRRTALVRVTRRQGWLWSRRQVGMGVGWGKPVAVEEQQQAPARRLLCLLLTQAA